MVFLFLVYGLDHVSSLIGDRIKRIRQGSFVNFLEGVIQTIGAGMFLCRIGLTCVLRVIFSGLKVMDGGEAIMVIVSRVLIGVVKGAKMRGYFYARVGGDLGIAIGGLYERTGNVTQGYLLASLVGLSY